MKILEVIEKVIRFVAPDLHPSQPIASLPAPLKPVHYLCDTITSRYILIIVTSSSFLFQNNLFIPPVPGSLCHWPASLSHFHSSVPLKSVCFIPRPCPTPASLFGLCPTSTFIARLILSDLSVPLPPVGLMSLSHYTQSFSCLCPIITHLFHVCLIYVFNLAAIISPFDLLVPS